MSLQHYIYLNSKNLSMFFLKLLTLKPEMVRSVRIIPGRRDVGGGVGVRAPSGGGGGSHQRAD